MGAGIMLVALAVVVPVLIKAVAEVLLKFERKPPIVGHTGEHQHQHR